MTGRAEDGGMVALLGENLFGSSTKPSQSELPFTVSAWQRSASR